MTRIRARSHGAAKSSTSTISESELEAMLFGERGLATMLEWQHAHFRPARTAHGWRTPVSGELGKGWPDHVLVRERDRRLIFAELKADAGELTADQERVLELLRCLELPMSLTSIAWRPRIEVHVWRPRDLDRIAEILR